MPPRREAADPVRLPEARAKVKCRWACAAGTSAVAASTPTDRASARIFMSRTRFTLESLRFPSMLGIVPPSARVKLRAFHLER